MKVRHYKHPEKSYTVLGTGIISALAKRRIADMDAVTIYADRSGAMYVCEQEMHDRIPSGFVIVGPGKAQGREPMKVADTITVYRSDEDGSTWVRRTAEFHDGRFAIDGGEATLLWQARYVLRDLHSKHPDCGYGKMAEACERAADRSLGRDVSSLGRIR